MIPSRIRMLASATVALMALTLLAVPVAIAAAPANDDFDSPGVISSLPYTTTLSTLEATTAADDPDCVGQGPTVWYAFAPASNLRIEANTFGSTYDTTLSVYTGARGSLTQIACNDDTNSLQSRVRFDATAGVTYFFMVGAYASGPGGDLVFAVAEVPPLPPPPTIDLSVTRTGSVDLSAGTVSLSGTVTCSRPAFIDLNVNVQQKVMRVNVIHGSTSFGIACAGETSWSATVGSANPNLVFTTGQASANVFAYAYDPEREEYIEDQVSRRVVLTGSQR